MAATENEISQVYKWLATYHHITVNGEWLEACISWLKQQSYEKTLVPLTDQVYEQWLMSDLTESGTTCLPPNVCTAAETKLQGFLPLQMNFVVNVGESAYRQWKKLKGENMPECEPKQDHWQSKPTRMLMLELTDGNQVVQGMEYKPIKLLHCGLTPGTKILIKGEAICRLGIIFLTENNIKILGGQVEILIEENSQINILHRIVMKDKQIKTGDSKEREEISNERIQRRKINKEEREMMEQLNKMEQNILLGEESHMVDEEDEREEIVGVEIGNSSRESMKENLPPLQTFGNISHKGNVALINCTTFSQRRGVDSNMVARRPASGITQNTQQQSQIDSRRTTYKQNKYDEIITDEDLAAFMSDDDTLLATSNLTYRNDAGLAGFEQSTAPLESVEDALDGLDEMEDITDEILGSLDEIEHLELGGKCQKESKDDIFEFGNTQATRNVNTSSNILDFSEDNFFKKSADLAFKQSSKKVNRKTYPRNTKRQTTLKQFTTKDPGNFIDLTDEDDFE